MAVSDYVSAINRYCQNKGFSNPSAWFVEVDCRHLSEAPQDWWMKVRGAGGAAACPAIGCDGQRRSVAPDLLVCDVAR
jgi:hypothetical protein